MQPSSICKLLLLRHHPLSLVALVSRHHQGDRSSEGWFTSSHAKRARTEKWRLRACLSCWGQQRSSKCFTLHGVRKRMLIKREGISWTINEDDTQEVKVRK